MSERTNPVRTWGGRIGRVTGRLALVGGLGYAVWGGSQIIDSTVVKPPNYNNTTTHSTTDVEYIEAIQHDADQLADGIQGLFLGSTVALGGYAISTMFYRRPEGILQTENLPDDQGGLDAIGAVDET